MLVRDIDSDTKVRIQKLASECVEFANHYGIKFFLQCRKYSPDRSLPDVLGTVIVTAETPAFHKPFSRSINGLDWCRVYFGPRRGNSVSCYLSMPGLENASRAWAHSIWEAHVDHWDHGSKEVSEPP